MITILPAVLYIVTQRLECCVTTQKTPGKEIACVASVSVRFRSKERGTRVTDHAKNGAIKKPLASFLASLRILRVRIEYFSLKIFVTLPHS